MNSSLKRIGITLLVIIPIVVGGCNDNQVNQVSNVQPTSTTADSKAKSEVSELGAPLVSSAGDTLINRIMAQDDPMRDPNWDWTTNTEDRLYLTTSPGSIQIKRPYYGSGSVKPYLVSADGSRDIWPKDGWELMLRDFGTSSYDVPTPFFILYNKYRGILRYFYYGNKAKENPKYVEARIKIQNGVQAPLFTLTDNTSQTLTNYSHKQHTFSEYYGDEWNFIDFNISGFDPDLASKYARFGIKIKGVSSYTLDGVASYSANGLLGAGGSTHSQLSQSVAGGRYLYSDISKAFKDIETAQQEFTDILKEQEGGGGSWWKNILDGAVDAATDKWIPELKPIVGKVKSIYGGGSSQSRQPAPITMIGGATIKGTLTEKSPYSNLGFIVPGAKVNNPDRAARLNELPLHNNIRPGLFNLSSAPTITATAYGDCYSRAPYETSKQSESYSSASVVIPYEEPPTLQSTPTPHRPPPGGSKCSTFYGYITYHISVDYVTNSDIFNNSETVEAALTYGHKTPTSFQDVTGGSTINFGVQFNNKDQWYRSVRGGWKNYFSQVGISAQLHPKNASSDVTPVSLLKAYGPTYGQIDNQGVTYH